MTILYRATLVAAALWLGGCAAAPVHQAPAAGTRQTARVVGRPAANPENRGQQIARIARQLVGTPYRYGGEDPTEGFDCSGLVFFTHRQVKLSIPRTSKAQYRAARPVSLPQAQPGDLVFFTDRTKLSHVGIYLGDKRFVHAPASGRTVSVARLDAPYYREHFVGLGRLY
jgi:cell wall-associated NlpC family hydrolase